MAARRIVLIDANVLINLIHFDALAIAAGLSEYQFVVLDAVAEEITDAQHALALQTAFDRSHLRRESLMEPDALALFAELVQEWVAVRPHLSRSHEVRIGILHAMRSACSEARQSNFWVKSDY